MAQRVSTPTSAPAASTCAHSPACHRRGRDRLAGDSGQFLVTPTGPDLADSRYTIQARREAPEARPLRVATPSPSPGHGCSLVGARRVAVEAGFVPMRSGSARGRRARRRARAGRGLGRGRSRRQGAGRVERIAAACAVADRALATLLPEIRPGVTEARPRPAARVAHAHRRSGGGRLRGRLPRRARGGPAARFARRPAGSLRRRPAVRLRRPGRRLSQRHDPDAVRRRADRTRPRRLRARRAGPGCGDRLRASRR